MGPSTEALAEMSVAGLVVFISSLAARTGGWLKRYPGQSYATEILGTTVFSWYLCLFSDWGLHKLGHLRLPRNKIYTIHMAHHKEASAVDVCPAGAGATHTVHALRG